MLNQANPTCPRCSGANPPLARFCNSCGLSLLEPAPTAPLVFPPPATPVYAPSYGQPPARGRGTCQILLLLLLGAVMGIVLLCGGSMLIMGQALNEHLPGLQQTMEALPGLQGTPGALPADLLLSAEERLALGACADAITAKLASADKVEVEFEATKRGATAGSHTMSGTVAVTTARGTQRRGWRCAVEVDDLVATVRDLTIEE